MQQSWTWWSFTYRGGVVPEDLLRATADIGYLGVEMLPVELPAAAATSSVAA